MQPYEALPNEPVRYAQDESSNVISIHEYLYLREQDEREAAREPLLVRLARERKVPIRVEQSTYPLF